MDQVVKQTSSLKDPTVDTSFLPDKERDRGIQIERRRLESEWQDTQDRFCKESLEISYRYIQYRILHCPGPPNVHCRD